MAVSLIEKITAGIRTYFASDIAARQVAQAALTTMLEGFGGDGVQDVDREAAKWRHGPTCAYHAFADRDCTCGAWEAFARYRSTAAAAERARIVAWLRTTCYGDPVEARAFADMIEEGETE